MKRKKKAGVDRISFRLEKENKKQKWNGKEKKKTFKPSREGIKENRKDERGEKG